jgi:hypothetical protein
VVHSFGHSVRRWYTTACADLIFACNLTLSSIITFYHGNIPVLSGKVTYKSSRQKHIMIVDIMHGYRLNASVFIPENNVTFAETESVSVLGTYLQVTEDIL